MGIIKSAKRIKKHSLSKGDRMDGFGICKHAKPFKEEKEEYGKFW